jgi:hypothetical protein
MTDKEILKLFHEYLLLEERHDKQPTGFSRDKLKVMKKVLRKELDGIFTDRPQSQLFFEAQ